MRSSQRCGGFGTTHLVRFVVAGAMEAYCGATRQDIYGYTKNIDRVTCTTCIRREVNNVAKGSSTPAPHSGGNSSTSGSGKPVEGAPIGNQNPSKRGLGKTQDQMKNE